MTLKAINPPPPRRKFTLDEVSEGRLSLPRRVFGYGVEGVGKSTFAAGAPSPAFLSPERGNAHLSIARLPSPESWDELLEVVSLLEHTDRFKTLVIDPVNWLEMLAWARVVGGPGARPDEGTADAIAKHGGGFNKGYDAAVGHWRTLVDRLERVWKTGKHVVLMAHSQVKSFNDPTGVSYDRYEPAMHHKGAGVLKQWCDDVFFIRHEVLRKQEGARAVAVATGARVIHTQWSKAWDAKTRAALPEELPLSWADYWEAVETTTRVEAVRARIAELVTAIDDPEVTRKAADRVTEAAGNVDRLAEIANQLEVKHASTKEKNA